MCLREDEGDDDRAGAGLEALGRSSLPLQRVSQLLASQLRLVESGRPGKDWATDRCVGALQSAIDHGDSRCQNGMAPMRD